MKTIKVISWVAGLALLISACTPSAVPGPGKRPAEVRPDGSSPTGSINGWLWHDECVSGMDGEPPLTETPPGCVKGTSAIGEYHANGTLEANEKPIAGVTVRLGEGACPSTGLEETMTIDTDLSYSFVGLKAGTYCVSIDPAEKANQNLLLPGVWTSPSVQEGLVGWTIQLAPGETKFNVNFGWDHQFRPQQISQMKRYIFQGVSYLPDPDVMKDNSAELLPEKPASDDIPYWEIKPETVSITPEGYPLAHTTLQPVIAVYPVADYRRLAEPAGKEIDSLIDLIARKPAAEKRMPFLPIINAGQVFHSNIKYLDFQNGSGVRYLTVLAQYPAPANNQDLFYTFQGLTADGRNYVSIIFPASHPSLPASPEALTLSELDQITKDATYYPSVSNKLTGFEGNSFTPDLEKLDAIVASLAIER